MKENVRHERQTSTCLFWSRLYKLVWDAIKTEIPNLKPKLQKIIAELEGNDKLKIDQR